VDTFLRDPKAGSAVAVPYLELFGTVAGGWLMAREAAAAHGKLENPASDREFLLAKIATARFYGEHILPRSRAYADTVVSGAASVTDFEEALL
jgi:acyl-CoA dehydrogenase